MPTSIGLTIGYLPHLNSNGMLYLFIAHSSPRLVVKSPSTGFETVVELEARSYLVHHLSFVNDQLQREAAPSLMCFPMAMYGTYPMTYPVASTVRSVPALYA
jgi:hypothetical protein